MFSHITVYTSFSKHKRKGESPVSWAVLLQFTLSLKETERSPDRLWRQQDIEHQITGELMLYDFTVVDVVVAFF